jgi:hypothetical protein
MKAIYPSAKTILACAASLGLLSAAYSATPTILANNVGNPDNIIIDESSVYWGDSSTGNISSVSKNPGGAVTHYAVVMVPGGDLIQDNASLYFAGAAFGGMFVGEHFVYKTPKFGGFANRIDTDFIYGGTLSSGTAAGILYYIGGARSIPGDNHDLWRPIVTLSTQGGNDSPLIYSNPAGIEAPLFQQDGLRYYLGNLPGHFSTDSAYLYWSDSDSTSIWQMPLIGGSATAIVSGRSNIRVIATPTTGAAAGSIFWVEGNIGSASLMRREVGGQVITVLTGITNATNRCFAVDDDEVFCEKGDGLVQVSINGGIPTVLASVDQAFGPVGVAVDSNDVYWSNLTGQVLRIARPTTGGGTPTPTPTPTPPIVLGNISTRLRVETGDNVLIGGFIVTGTQPKKIIVRAIGPSLSFPDKLADPILELHDASGALLETNDNWVDSPNKQAIIDSTIPPTNDLESAIVRSVPPGNYTAVVRGVNNGTGIGVVEAYDLDTSADSKLANISTRGLVQTGDNVLIAGTIVVGQTSQKVIIRGIGPSLSVPGKLSDPTLELRDGNGALLEGNDNWQDSPNKQAIIDSTIPPGDPLESAIVRVLPPGNYTAILRGVNNATGIAVVEVYALN